MTNTSNPTGFTPVKSLSGSTTPRMTAYTIANAYATALGKGDPVKSTGTGKNVSLAAAGETMVGIFAGCEYTDASGKFQRSAYWPAAQVATDAVAFVYDDPNQIFEVQVDGVGLALNDLQSMSDHATGTATTLHSTAVLSATNIAAGGAVGFKILDLAAIPGNDYGVSAKALVIINEHELRTMTAI